MNQQITNSFLTNINDLLEIQRASFYRFLVEGISKELNSIIINPFIVLSLNNHSLLNSKSLVELENQSESLFTSFYLYPSKIKVKGPLKSLETCYGKRESYCANIYVQGEILQPSDSASEKFYKPLGQEFNEKAKKGVKAVKLSAKLAKFRTSKFLVKKYFYLATIPFLTEDGSFFVNGCERVVVNQIVRSPGIYFKKEYLSSQKTIYSATFISDNWLWTKFRLENSSSIAKKQNDIENATTKTATKPALKYDIFLDLIDSNFWREIPVLKEAKDGSNELFLIDLILSLGFTIEEILDGVKYPDKLSIPDYLNQSFLLNSGKQNALAPYQNEDWSNVKSEKFIKKEALLTNILEHIANESEEKIFFSLGELGRYRLNKKLGLNLPLSSKYLTGLDFLKIIDSLIQLREGNLSSDDIDDLKNKQIRGVGELIRNQFRLAMFRWLKHPKSAETQIIDIFTTSKSLIKNSQNNSSFYFKNFALSSILKRAIERCMREFFLTSQLSQYFDEINPLAELAHKRRISVFGPDGLQRDKIGTKIRDIHPSQYGKICPVETPEGENAGLVMSLASFARVSKYGWIEAPYFLVEKGKILQKTKIFYLNPNQEKSYRLAFANNILDSKNFIKTNSVSVKEGSYFSEAQPKNVTFSALSPLQVLSVGTNLVPFVEHDDANRALMGSNMQRQAVPLLFPSLPFVGTGFEPLVAQESGLTIKSEVEGIVDFASSEAIQIRDAYGQKIHYKLKKNIRSNQETLNNQRTIFWPGEKIYAGQILVDSSSTVNGDLALGTNLLIGYLPWEGYNYEDAIVISEKLVTDDILTSLHISTYQTTLKFTKATLQKITYLLKFSRKIRGLKAFIKNLQISKTLNSSESKNLFIKLARQIHESKKLLVSNYNSKLSLSLEYLVGKDKMGLYTNDSKGYLGRNLSTNGIIKIGSSLKGGDILVSKIQFLDELQEKSSYKKLFEDLQPVAAKLTKDRNNKKKIKVPKILKFYNLTAEKIKLQKILRYLQKLTKNYSKLLYLNSYTFTYKKCLKSESKASLKFLTNFYNQLAFEIKKYKKVGTYLSRILQLISYIFYKKVYKNFYMVELAKKTLILKTISLYINNKKTEKEFANSKVLLPKLYLKLKDERVNNLSWISKEYLKIAPLLHTKNKLFKTNITGYQKPNFSPILIKHLSKFETLLRLCNLQENERKSKNISLSSATSYKDTSLLFPMGSQGKVIDVKIFPLSNNKEESSAFTKVFILKIYVVESRKIQIGDKLSGRHGNKGVISRILPLNDMPCLPDGRPLDILVNPLGVPSRMNVGQLLECLLGLSMMYSGKNIKIRPFDEVFGAEASRALVIQKLKEASLKPNRSWLYNIENPGKFYLRDGRTGDFFDNAVTVGAAYILKLIHLVEDKIHSRALGPYNKITEQPLQGKSSSGGQRFGEMEVWALESYGCANTLQELLTVKSDDIDGRNDLYSAISSGNYLEKPNPNFSETLISLIRELNALGLDFQFFKTEFQPLLTINSRNVSKTNRKEIKIFTLLENRLKLRFKLNRLKSSNWNLEALSNENFSSNKDNFEEQKSILFKILET